MPEAGAVDTELQEIYLSIMDIMECPSIKIVMIIKATVLWILWDIKYAFVSFAVAFQL